MNSILAQPIVDSAASEASWVELLDRIIAKAEGAEHVLAHQGEADLQGRRKITGSYYTPADVAEHFWDLFFRVHGIGDARSLLQFMADSEFIEPSAGSGIFFFSFVKKALLLGASIESVSEVRFNIIDVNLAALRFFSERLHELEAATGIRFAGVSRSQSDFLDWVESCKISNAVFVGNPPYVSNPKGRLWKNLFAEFLEAMMVYESKKAISLILPLSVCFSRDYRELRNRISSSGMGISASSYDNRPDCLFNSGKPESTNTNRVNSQRCTILNLGGLDPSRREASPLINWMAAERSTVLSQTPNFFDFDDHRAFAQIPRPASLEIQALMGQSDVRPLGAFINKLSAVSFRVGGVARNYIGIREANASPLGSIAIRTGSRENLSIVLQALTSRLFFEYWKTYGDGFHVTQELIVNFPITSEMLLAYKENESEAHKIWSDRSKFAKSKLNSGKVISSYDFTSAF